jgi:hypothetical protein
MINIIDQPEIGYHLAPAGRPSLLIPPTDPLPPPNQPQTKAEESGMNPEAFYGPRMNPGAFAISDRTMSDMRQARRLSFLKPQDESRGYFVAKQASPPLNSNLFKLAG